MAGMLSFDQGLDFCSDCLASSFGQLASALLIAHKECRDYPGLASLVYFKQVTLTSRLSLRFLSLRLHYWRSNCWICFLLLDLGN